MALTVCSARLHFGRDNRKSLAGRVGARGLDGRVQRQQVGLSGNRLDEIDDVADPGGHLQQTWLMRTSVFSACSMAMRAEASIRRLISPIEDDSCSLAATVSMGRSAAS